MTPASRDDVPDLWEGPGTFVRALSAAEVEDLTRASAYRPAAHDTLLVVYAPWCPWCKDMEAAFEATARTLSNDPDVVVAKVKTGGGVAVEVALASHACLYAWLCLLHSERDDVTLARPCCWASCRR